MILVYSTFGSYKMKLNRELCQRCRQGVMLFEQDNSFETAIV